MMKNKDKNTDPEATKNSGETRVDESRGPANRSAEKTPPLSAMRSKARHYAMQGLYQWRMSAAPLDVIEAEFHSDNDMSHVDTDYFHELLHGVPAHLAELETDFLPFVNDLSLEQIDPITLALLRMACYELRFRVDVPYRVVINEALRLAKKFGATDSFKFLNGVLDKVAARVRTVEVKADRH